MAIVSPSGEGYLTLDEANDTSSSADNIRYSHLSMKSDFAANDLHIVGIDKFPEELNIKNANDNEKENDGSYAYASNAPCKNHESDSGSEIEDAVTEDRYKEEENKYETSTYQSPDETETKNVEYAGFGDNPDYIQDRESGDTSTGVTHFSLDEETSKMAENDNDKSTYSPPSDRDADKLEYAGVGENKETENIHSNLNGNSNDQNGYMILTYSPPCEKDNEKYEVNENATSKYQEHDGIYTYANNSPCIYHESDSGSEKDNAVTEDRYKEENKYEASAYEAPDEADTKNVEYVGIGNSSDFIIDREAGNTSTGGGIYTKHFSLDEEINKVDGQGHGNANSTQSPTSDRDADKLEYVGICENKETENSQSNLNGSIMEVNENGHTIPAISPPLTQDGSIMSENENGHTIPACSPLWTQESSTMEENENGHIPACSPLWTQDGSIMEEHENSHTIPACSPPWTQDGSIMEEHENSHIIPACVPPWTKDEENAEYISTAKYMELDNIHSII